MRTSLDDYLRLREAQLRVLGVLPRSRRPVSICFHSFLLHPFGKDYRQDVLRGPAAGDELVFVKSNLCSSAGSSAYSLLPAVAVRQSLKEVLKNEMAAHRYLFPVLDSVRSAVLGRQSLVQDAEFAREMQMFPLAIKNPDVPIMGQKSSRHSGPPLKDPNRLSTGPER